MWATAVVEDLNCISDYIHNAELCEEHTFSSYNKVTADDGSWIDKDDMSERHRKSRVTHLHNPNERCEDR